MVYFDCSVNYAGGVYGVLLTVGEGSSPRRSLGWNCSECSLLCLTMLCCVN